MAKDLVCSACGSNGKTKTITRGSILIEILLWLCFLIPGLIYSIWRLTTRREACATCGSLDMVPTTTPRGRELMARYNPGATVGAAAEALPRGNATRGYVYMAILAVLALAAIASLIG